MEQVGDMHAALERLLQSSPGDLAHRDIAEMNLLCAVGLPGAEDLDIPALMAKLDEWTEVVRQVTARRLPQLLARPQRMTESQMRLWLVIRTLRDRFGIVHRDGVGPDAQMGPRVARAPEHKAAFADFGDSRPIFIHGVLGPGRTGTCSSMPVLYAAAARRLGYPVMVASNTGHVFNRWDDGHESFTMEGTCADYINIHPDDYYIDDVRPWTDYERYNNYLLQGRSPAEELALFCDIRAACLYKNNRFDEALACWTRAWELRPEEEGLGSNLRWALNQQLPEYVRRNVLPPSPHFNYQYPDNFIAAIAPPRTQAVLFAARGIFHAFHERMEQAREAMQTACRIAPNNPAYPQLLATLDTRQYHRLPPSRSVLAGIKAGNEAEDLIQQQKLPEAVARLAKAHRLHPRCRIYWDRIADIVKITHGSTDRPRPYPHAEVATLLGHNGHWFLKRNQLPEARYAFEEALHLTRGEPRLRAGMIAVVQKQHELAQTSK